MKIEPASQENKVARGVSTSTRCTEQPKFTGVHKLEEQAPQEEPEDRRTPPARPTSMSTSCGASSCPISCRESGTRRAAVALPSNYNFFSSRRRLG